LWRALRRGHERSPIRALVFGNCLWRRQRLTVSFPTERRGINMRIRVLVADQSEAKFYDMRHRPEPLQLVGRMLDPLARLHDRDFKSDRPGRVFDHAPMTPGRRGATPRHATAGERRPRKHEAQEFARQIAGELDRGQQQGEFDSVIVIAGPAFLGLLRETLTQSVRSIVVAEVPKDLVHQDVSAIIKHLPPRPSAAAS
jgi:protein required for attachment to host cells